MRFRFEGRALVANGHVWRVSDFVTLGSPLADADILLAEDKTDRIAKQAARELPTCLPALETSRTGKQSMSYAHRATYKSNGKTKTRRVTVPHHAAVFAPTRWTCVYFPPEAVIKGDVISGLLRPVFGSVIRDVAVHTGQRGGYSSHTLYWSTRSLESDPEPHIFALRWAIALD